MTAYSDPHAWFLPPDPADPPRGPLRERACPSQDTDAHGYLWYCTAVPGHAGPHVAHDNRDRVCARWPQERLN